MDEFPAGGHRDFSLWIMRQTSYRRPWMRAIGIDAVVRLTDRVLAPSVGEGAAGAGAVVCWEPVAIRPPLAVT